MDSNESTGLQLTSLGTAFRLPAVPRDAGEAPGELEAHEAASDGLDQDLPSRAAVEDPEGLTNLETLMSDELDKNMPCDPFEKGLLSLEEASGLLDIFRAKLVPHFPFVVVSPTTSLGQLHQQRPALCLAILAAASFGNLRLQRSLGALFNELVGERIAKRMAKDRFATLDMLQALLVHVSWYCALWQNATSCWLAADASTGRTTSRDRADTRSTSSSQSASSQTCGWTDQRTHCFGAST